MLRRAIVLFISFYLVWPGVSGALAEPRIVSTDAAVTQILFALGGDSALVGVDVTSTLPPGYRKLPLVGYHRALPAEGLLALNPTLVIGSDHMGPPIVLTTLASASIPVLQLPAANSIEALRQNIGRIAAAVGDETRAKPVLEQLDTQAAQLAAAPLRDERFAFVLAVEAGKLRIAGRGTAGDAFIHLLGAHNIADFDAYRTVSAEALLALAPTTLLVANHEDATPDRVLALNPILKHGEAAGAGHILAVNAANLVAGLSPGAVADAVALAATLGAAPAR